MYPCHISSGMFLAPERPLETLLGTWRPLGTLRAVFLAWE